ncbi:DUF106 domain-containing protein [Candidatus Woesearchaeota archaeon]|nr:DUF106 domain-containing protein [Candidatus Woesearchaeota archaeon]
MITIIKSLPPLAAIFLISFAISLAITVVYKYTTNQKFMKALQGEMKDIRQQIKNTKDTAQAGILNKKLMEKTMQQMMHSMKSTFITIIPIFLIFGWMNSNLAYEQAAPNEEFTTTMQFHEGTGGAAAIESPTLQILSNSTQQITGNKAAWTLKGAEGKHEIFYTYAEERYKREVLLTGKWEYADPTLEKKSSILGIINIGDKNPIKEGSGIKKITIDLRPVHPFGSLKLFGWQPGWLATYFLFMLAMTFPLRKLLRVH